MLGQFQRRRRVIHDQKAVAHTGDIIAQNGQDAVVSKTILNKLKKFESSKTQ